VSKIESQSKYPNATLGLFFTLVKKLEFKFHSRHL